MKKTEKKSEESEIEVVEDEENSDDASELREEAMKLQKIIQDKAKELKNSRQYCNQLEKKIVDFEKDLKKITQERDRHKELYTNLIKTKIDSKIVIDSQKRLMDKYVFITEQVNSRPSTGKRPVTASGLRMTAPKTFNIN